jgi:hypothetical protein
MKALSLGACREPQCRVIDREQRGDRRDGCIVRTGEGSDPSNQDNVRRTCRAGCSVELGTARRRSIARPALQQAIRLLGARASRRRVSAGVCLESNVAVGGGSNFYGLVARDRGYSHARLVAKLECLFMVGAKLMKTVQARRDARS